MVTVLAGVVVAARSDVPALEQRGFRPLFNGKDTTG
jgi:hypothetical protein